MKHSNKIALALLACMLTTPALADEVAEAYGGGYEKRQQRLDKIKATSHERTLALMESRARLDACVQAATTLDAAKACHAQAREARKARLAEMRAERDDAHAKRKAARERLIRAE